jgi:catechol 2,3-dioxygenase-like lactoylglutathione lyase family enzyme
MVRWLAALLLFAAPASAQQIEPRIEPWSEAVVSVEDISKAKQLFVKVGGWRVKHKGKVARAELDYWKLPAKASATFERLCAPEVDTGCIRFVSFKGVEQRPIRLATRAWDTGGIYSIMVRSDNVPALFDAAINLGWWAESEPVRFQFGQSDLRNVVLTGPHGINLAVYERISPPFTAFPVGRLSQGFNSMRMVRSKPASRAFYEKLLGFSVVFDSGFEPADPAYSNFGIPYNYTPQIKRSAAALQPVNGETGRVEVMQIDGFTGRDVSAFASPPNLGILSVRYRVNDLADYRAKLESSSVPIAYDRNFVEVKGIGMINLLAVRDPDGNLTEFYEYAPIGE